MILKRISTANPIRLNPMNSCLLSITPIRRPIQTSISKTIASTKPAVQPPSTSFKLIAQRSPRTIPTMEMAKHPVFNDKIPQQQSFTLSILVDSQCSEKLKKNNENLTILISDKMISKQQKLNSLILTL